MCPSKCKELEYDLVVKVGCFSLRTVTCHKDWLMNKSRDHLFQNVLNISSIQKFVPGAVLYILFTLHPTPYVRQHFPQFT